MQAYQTTWRKNNASRVREYERVKQRKYRADPLNHQKDLERHRRYNERNRSKNLQYALNRQAGRQLLLNQLKDKPCADCGHKYHPCVMDFDHVRGEKFMDLSDMKSRSIGLIMEEVSKCDVVCANCHRMRTFTRRQSKAA